LPNNATTTITGKTTITGEGGIAIQRGTLNIGSEEGSNDDISITAKATTAATIPATGDGTWGLQVAALSASARYGTETINIYGGKFTVGDATNAKIIDLTYNGAIVADVINDVEHYKNITIKGGTFSSDPSSIENTIYTFNTDGSTKTSESKAITTWLVGNKILADDYKSTQNDDNTWTVSQK
jgi:hypothetical protein